MKPTRQTGFTLVELILVMVVMGLLAGVALPSLTNRQSQDELTTRDELRATLRLARQVATSQGLAVCFMRTAAQWRLVYAAAGVCNWAGTPVVAPGTQDVTAVGMAPDPVLFDLPAGVVLVGNNTIQFDSRGRLVPFAVDANIRVGSSQAFIVSRETGFVY